MLNMPLIAISSDNQAQYQQILSLMNLNFLMEKIIRFNEHLR